jgi:flagellar FliJ protein
VKVFRFSLEPVLRAKTVQEKAQKVELAKWMQRTRELEEQLAVLHTRIDSGKKMVAKALAEGVDPDDLSAWDACFTAIREDIRGLVEAIEETYRETEACRRLLVETLKEKKVLEKYKDRLFQEYLQKMRRMDEKALDEYMSTSALMG